MCGRARCSLEPEAVVQYAKGVSGCAPSWENKEGYHPSHNVSPGTRMPVLRKAAAGAAESSANLTLHTMRWGLVPSFTKATDSPDFWKMFNARSEGVLQRPVFSRLMNNKRCIVLMEGFYEWRQEGPGSKTKQPYYVHLSSAPVLCFAGLYDSWHEASTGEDMYTYTILTTDSCPRLKWLHTRMPVILRDAAACTQWLEGGPGDDLAALFKPYNGEDLVWHEVTPKMNKADYKEADCAKPLKVPKLDAFFRAAGPKAEEAGQPAAEHDEHHGPTNTDGAGIKSEAELLVADVPRKRPPVVSTTPSPAKRKKQSKDTTPQKGQPSMHKFFSRD